MKRQRVRVWKAAHLWHWACRRGPIECGWGYAPSQPRALTGGLMHLELWHNDPARRTA